MKSTQNNRTNPMSLLTINRNSHKKRRSRITKFSSSCTSVASTKVLVAVLTILVGSLVHAIDSSSSSSSSSSSLSKRPISSLPKPINLQNQHHSKPNSNPISAKDNNNSDDDDNDDTLSLLPPSPSLGLLFSHYFPPPLKLIKWTCTGLQLGISYYLVKTIWKAFSEVWDELAQELNAGEYNNNNERAGKEEHDLPFVSGESVDAFTAARFQQFSSSSKEKQEESEMKNDNNNQSFPSEEKKKQQQQTQQQQQLLQQKVIKSPRQHLNPVAYDLAARLHASGIPYASSFPSTSPSQHSQQHHQQAAEPLTVERILKSLTKTEGYILSNTLLSPIDSGGYSADSSGGANTNDKNKQQQQQQQQMWDDIGGLNEAKESLLDLVFPLLASAHHSRSNQSSDSQQSQHPQHSDSYYGGLLTNPPGVLLYGPPGCGKTMLVRALARTTTSVPFLCIRPSTLLRKYVGETNLFVRALFSLVQKLGGTCILFVDELDGLFRERSGSNGSGGGGGGEEHDVNRDLKTEFMQLWDGIYSNNGKEKKCGGGSVLIIGATNRPFDVDSAFLRRMPRSIYVGLPDYTTRILVLRSMLKDVPVDEKEFNVEEIARWTEGYSPSDLKELLRSAALGPMREARRFMMERHLYEQQQQQMQFETDEKKKNDEGDGNHIPSSSSSSSSSSFSPFHNMPPLRKLTTSDVLQARRKVSPTQLSPGYTAALVAYAKRARGEEGGEVGEGIGSGQYHHNQQQQQPPFHPFHYGMPNYHHPHHHHPYNYHGHHQGYSSFDANNNEVNHNEKNNLDHVSTYFETHDFDNQNGEEEEEEELSSSDFFSMEEEDDSASEESEDLDSEDDEFL